MRYAAIITQEGTATLAEFPDCPGCQTFIRGKGDIANAALEALEGWLEATMATGQLPPLPAGKPRRKGTKVLWVTISPNLAVKILFRQARLRLGLTQAELAKRANVSQQQIAKLENPDSNPTLGTLEEVARALGVRIDVVMEPLDGGAKA